MKRKSPLPERGGGSHKKRASASAPFLRGVKVLLVEDGRGNGMPSKRVGMFVDTVKQAGGSAEVLMAGRITEGQRLSPQERDKRLLHTTHVVTALEHLGARGVLEGLRVLVEPGDPAPATAPPLKIVKPDWLSDCFARKALVDEAAYELPFEPSEAAVAAAAASTSTSTSTSSSGKKRAQPGSPPAGPPGHGHGHGQSQVRLVPPPRTRAEIEAVLDEHFPDLDVATREDYIAWGGPLDIRQGAHMPHFACQRPAPRQHPNRHLTPVFEEVQDFYNATGDRERETSWGRALGVLRAWPRKITASAQIRGAPNIGPSMREEVDQILRMGTTERLETLRSDPRNVGLRDLTRIHQVGHATAAKYYDAGYHSVAQIMAELDAAPDGDPTQTRFYQTIKPSHEPWMGVVHFRDYSQKMTRAQIAGIEALVRQAALAVLAARGFGPETLLLETCGGYRRGKEENGDADVLVSCREAEAWEGLTAAIKKEMEEGLGLELIVLKEGGAVQGYGTDKTHEKLPSHDNMLTLIKFEGLYRRLDIISPPPDQWAACVLGWSGTKQMEKDLRDYATDNGYYLTQQALYKLPKRLPNPNAPDGLWGSEQEIWDFLGLRFLPPRLRWA